jgi:tetratricopeptide (TPR) repeat protein
MQPLAAHIACQAEQLSSIVSLHHDDWLGMEAHRQRAVFFGQLSGDVNLHVTAIMRLATTYYYLKRARKAYETYQQALPHVQAVTPLVRARVYIGLAEAAARCGEVQQALTYRTKAHEAFPDHPNQDPSAFFADGGHFTLALWESMAYMELGQPENAAAVLQDVQQKPALLLPARVQAELINHQAQAEIAMGHMEESAVLVEEGVKQALKLGSQRRYSEAYDNYQAMRLLWHREQRVKSLDELFRRS